MLRHGTAIGLLPSTEWLGQGTHPDAPADWDADLANIEPDGLEELTPRVRELWARGASMVLAKLKEQGDA